MTSEPSRPRLAAAHRVRVTPDDVGRRVTIRHLVEEEGRTRPTDVVGHLEAWTGDDLRVRRRDGQVVTVAAHTVVASRVIPDPPVRRSARG